MRRLIAPLLLLLFCCPPAVALDLVATSPSMGALARAVTGGSARVTELSGPDRDLHSLQVRPSMMQALRSADLVIAIGAELEIGWLPPAITAAGNPAILPGRDGYFEAAAQVPLLDAGAAADRAQGDVHPVGNPHVNMDPLRMATVAEALAGRLGLLDPAGAARYRENAAAFRAAVAARVADWQARLRGAPGVVLQHRDAVYLLDRFDVTLLGTLEPVPGVAPTGRQISALVAKLRTAGRGVIIIAPWHAPRPAERLAGELGWPLHRLPLEPPAGADGEAWLDHLGRWVAALAGTP